MEPDREGDRGRRGTSVTAHSRIIRSLLVRSYYLRLRARGWRLRFLALAGVVRVGRRPFLGSHVDLQIHGELIVGHHVHLDHGSSVQVGPGAKLTLGDGVYLGIGSVVNAAMDITIGDRVLVAEHCSIRDSDHDVEPLRRRQEALLRDRLATPVVIGNDVWMGAGVRVLRGSRLGAGCVAAANAVVRGAVPERVVVGGIPAKVLRSLDPDSP
jgi:acetyltransferase-like isoleucine patch superfamily enzyme